ncbi:hypothetical protein SDC9_94576 [bioreactor metagenome]|uniref:Uncharacterized protein n=1 Tax=bioreactor metagenome TaxID=1076179 RepID=A0A645A3T6_9ZZZZ
MRENIPAWRISFSGVSVVRTVRADLQIDNFPGIVELQIMVAAPSQRGAVRVETVADDGADIAFNFGIGADSHRSEDAEALALKVTEALAGLIHVTSVGTTAVGVEQNLCWTHQAAHFVKPALGIVGDFGKTSFLQVYMRPGVGSKGPAFLLEFGDDRLYGFDFLLAVCLEGGELRGVGDVPVGLGAIAQNTLEAGQADAALSSVEGKVRMLPHELVHQSDGIQILRNDFFAVAVQTPAPDLSVVSQDELVCKAVLEHVVVVIYVVVGNDDRLFAFRKHQGVPFHSGLAGIVCVLRPDRVDVDQDVIVCVEGLENRPVLLFGHHPVVDAVGHVVSVKGQLSVGHHRVEKDMFHNSVVWYQCRCGRRRWSRSGFRRRRGGRAGGNLIGRRGLGRGVSAGGEQEKSRQKKRCDTEFFHDNKCFLSE